MDRPIAERDSQSAGSYNQLKLDTLHRLEDGTKKLLDQLELLKTQPEKNTESVDIQTSNHSEFIMPYLEKQESEGGGPKSWKFDRTFYDQINYEETYQKAYDFEDICSCTVFKKLCRKCMCLKDQRFNDFVIHFNESSKYMTTTLGEVLKNIRILKKFLYMGGDYTKNALMFLNEGLTKSESNEKLEIIFACSCADICNIFEDSSIVTFYIIWPCKFKNWGDSETQALTAKLLQRIADMPDGKVYLNLNSKIASDLNTVLKKMTNKVDENVLQTVHETFMLLGPPATRNMNVATYFCASKIKKRKINVMNIKDIAKAFPGYTKPLTRNNAGQISIYIESKKRQKRSPIRPTYTS